MASIINLRASSVVVGFSLLLLALTGCSFFGDDTERANTTISSANASIQEHNQLFQRARDTYETVKANIEDGDDPSAQQEDIVRARNSMQEARGRLQDARDDLSEVQDLDVREPIKNYASALSGAMESQMEAEAREIEFYNILEGDPALEDGRQDALDLLSQVGEGYAAAEDDYQRAQEIANSNSDLLGPAGGQAGQAGN